MKRIPVILFLSAALFAGDFDGQTDIGASVRPGSREYDGATGVYKVSGGGANIWGTADAFHLVWKRLSGDFALETRVMLEPTDTGANPHRKAGLMIRQSLEPGAPYVDVMVHGEGLTALQFRKTAGGDTDDLRSPAAFPAVIRLERHGDMFEMWVAATAGEGLRKVASVSVPLQDPVYAGLAVCSHDAARMEQAEFSGVKIEPAQR
jgi:hypothetical protein